MADMIPVDSTAISHMGYNNGALTVNWRGGGQTTYLGVPEQLWELLRGSSSKGRFIAQHLRGRFEEA